MTVSQHFPAAREVTRLGRHLKDPGQGDCVMVNGALAAKGLVD
ncbi:MAG: hypothetical protein ACLQVM_10545 [Terriglobia bacterium]